MLIIAKQVAYADTSQTTLPHRHRSSDPGKVQSTTPQSATSFPQPKRVEGPQQARADRADEMCRKPKVWKLD